MMKPPLFSDGTIAFGQKLYVAITTITSAIAVPAPNTLAQKAGLALTLLSVWSTGLSIAPTPAHGQTLTENFLNMERGLEKDFETYFGENLADVTQTPDDVIQVLQRIGTETGTTPAVIWAIPRGDHLHLVLLTPDQQQPIIFDRYDVPTHLLRRAVQQFRREVSNPNRRRPMVGARQLHQWMIEPFESEYLKAAGVDTLLFCLGTGLRGIPLTALHDGERFLVERYNVAQIPAFNLIQTDYQALEHRQILAMGASEFQYQAPLPAVPVELTTILNELGSGRMMDEQWDGEVFLNQDFTLPALQQRVEKQSFDVVHLATHAEFLPGAPEQSYIQFWDTQLGLNRTNAIDWDLPPLELLVLSACRTALGDDMAELGFAGLALKSGVKSAIASLWYVSDVGTLALMTEFYQHLGLTTTKVAALREAQLGMLNGKIRIDNHQLVLSDGQIDLPPELQDLGSTDFRHPFYWAGFTMISSPW